MAVILLYYTEFGKFGANYVKVLEVMAHTVRDRNVALK